LLHLKFNIFVCEASYNVLEGILPTASALSIFIIFHIQ